MKKYFSFFRMRFITGLQYRLAALAGIATQFFWGIMEILMFRAFYEADPSAFPMDFSALSSYIWLQQALLAMYLVWSMDGQIFRSISDGGIAYELCRPIDIYPMWFAKSMAHRISGAVLRCMPILIISSFIKKPYGLSLPKNGITSIFFIVSLILAFLLVVAFCMLIYLLSVFTVSSVGIRVVINSASELFTGAVLPIPFFPDKIRQIIEILPFASMQNVPFRIYSGDIAGFQIGVRIALQLFWILVIIAVGRLLTAKVMRRTVLQGG